MCFFAALPGLCFGAHSLRSTRSDSAQTVSPRSRLSLSGSVARKPRCVSKGISDASNLRPTQRTGSAQGRRLSLSIQTLLPKTKTKKMRFCFPTLCRVHLCSTVTRVAQQAVYPLSPRLAQKGDSHWGTSRRVLRSPSFGCSAFASCLVFWQIHSYRLVN